MQGGDEEVKLNRLTLIARRARCTVKRDYVSLSARSEVFTQVQSYVCGLTTELCDFLSKTSRTNKFIFIKLFISKNPSIFPSCIQICVEYEAQEEKSPH